MPETELGPAAEPYVNDHGAVPVNAMLMVEEVPEQMVAFPEMVAVGKGLTVAATDVLVLVVQPLLVAST